MKNLNKNAKEKQKTEYAVKNMFGGRWIKQKKGGKNHFFHTYKAFLQHLTAGTSLRHPAYVSLNIFGLKSSIISPDIRST